MSANSTIEWTDATWNPVRGCTKISPGCARCYAETFAERFRGVPGHPYEQGFDLRLVQEKLFEPLNWRKSRMVFVNSMSDLFHEDIPIEYVVAVVRVMTEANWHTYQVLTKRAERMRDMLHGVLGFAAQQPHIWWGVSVENRKQGLPRVEHLRAASAAVRFLSVEPLLEDIGLLPLDGIHWVIVGGESGPRARPMMKEWVLSIQRQCRQKRVPFFFKQWGGVRKKENGRTLDGKTFDAFPKRSNGRAVLKNRPKQIKIAEYHANGGESMAKTDSNVASHVGPWATEKLEYLRKYLHAYTTIMRKQRWCQGYVYVDAFAGPGLHEIRARKESGRPNALLELSSHATAYEEQHAFQKGSPRIALDIDHPFSWYVFVEKSPERVAELISLKEEFSETRNILVRQRDCNSYLLEKLARNPDIDWKSWRAFVFLDPFGMQVPWKTIVALARTKGIEILVNFPVGMAIQRLIRKDNKFSPAVRRKLDEYFGTKQWHSVMYRRERTLFGEDDERKVEKSGKALVNWYRDRLNAIFPNVSNAVLVRNTQGGHLYYLLFATHNPKGLKIANHVLSAGETV